MPRYTPEQLVKRNASVWTDVQLILAPIQFLVFLAGDTVAPEIAMEGREAPPAASVAAVHEPDPTGSTGVVTGENDLKPSLIPHDAVISLEPAEYRTPEVPEPVTEDLEPTDSPAEEPQITQVAEPVLSDPETESEPEPEPEPEFEAPEGEVAAIEAPSPAVEAPEGEVAAIEAPAPAVEAPAVEAPPDERRGVPSPKLCSREVEEVVGL